MNKKQVLKYTLSFLAISSIAFTAVPFINSLLPSESSKNDSFANISVPELKQGELVKIKLQGKNLYIFKPTNEQLSSLSELDEHVWSKATNSFKSNLGAFVYWGISTRWGCQLEHKPEEVSRLLEYEEKAVWLGGFWDGSCEISYDYSGRAIKNYNYTYNGFAPETDNLYTPSIFEKQGSHYNVSLYLR